MIRIIIVKDQSEKYKIIRCNATQILKIQIIKTRVGRTKIYYFINYTLSIVLDLA